MTVMVQATGGTNAIWNLAFRTSNKHIITIHTQHTVAKTLKVV